MKFDHIGISVSNLNKSLDFYKSNFGFQEVVRFTKKEWDGEAVKLKLGKMELELFCFNNAKSKKGDYSDLETIGIKHIAFLVEDIDKIYRELKNKGLDIDEPKIGTTVKKFCFLRDPDKISIELIER